MITVNSKTNKNPSSGDENFNEFKLPEAMQVKNDGLEKMDKHAEQIQKDIKPVGDWADLLNTTTDSVTNAINSATTDRRSIIARAKNSIIQFPIYIVDNVNISAAHIVAKAFERVYASFVQTVLSQYPVVDENSINDLAFLKQFHTNIRESANSLFNEYYQPIDDFDEIMQESISNTVLCEDGIMANFNVAPCTNSYLIAENARLLNEPLQGFENYFIEAKMNDAANLKKLDSDRQDVRSTHDPQGDIIAGMNEQDVLALFDQKEPVEPKEPTKNTLPPEPKFFIRDGEEKSEAQIRHAKDLAEYNAIVDEKMGEYEDAVIAYKDALEKYGADKEIFLQSIKDGVKVVYNKDGAPVLYNKEKDQFYVIKPGVHKITTSSRQVSAEFKAPAMLRDSDIKKINGMLPYTFDASFTIKSKTTPINNIVHYIIGVKSVLHLIKANDLSEELQGLVTGDIKNLQKVRYKTGEIAFWKDYIFRKGELKRDASKQLDSGKRWINTLKQLSQYNKEYGSLLDKPASLLAGGDIPIPNATLILTQPVVQKMKNETGINLEDVAMAKKLAKNLFLISIVILDSSAGNMKVLFTDTNNAWDIQSLASIETEIAKTDNSNLIKELNQIINK
jgi:hypothetical protein